MITRRTAAVLLGPALSRVRSMEAPRTARLGDVWLQSVDFAPRAHAAPH